MDLVAKIAPVKVTRSVRTARQVMSPIECRGFIAQWDSRLDQLILHGATQFPHVVRSGLAQVLQVPELKIRVVSPDVGGGFGYKALLAGEEICLCWLAMHVKYPVRWLEDRREMLVANANCREHYYDMTAYADRTGKILAFDAKAIVDTGSYSAYPFTAAIEASQVSAILPGPYDIPVYRCVTSAVATNKAPQLPYRGVARPGCCYAMELMVDAIAREIGREPHEVRTVNLVRPEQMPYDNVTDKHFDSGDYPQLLRMAVEAIDASGVRARQRRDESDGRLIGLGINFLGADGSRYDRRRQAPGALRADLCASHRRPARDPSRHSEHRPGNQTTLAQIGSEILGLDLEDIQVKLGDTETSPYSSGAWGSRGMIWAGRLTSRACKELAARVARIGAALLQTDKDLARLRDNCVFGPSGSVSLRAIAQAYYLSPGELQAISMRMAWKSPAASRRRASRASTLGPPMRPSLRSIPDRRGRDSRLRGGRGCRHTRQSDDRR